MMPLLSFLFGLVNHCFLLPELAADRDSRGQLTLDIQEAAMDQSSSLLRRDLCTDAFGAGWLGSTCTPGATYCCVNKDQNYPQCSQFLGLGWCCTESEGGCYVDLTSSACGQPGAVSCTELASGVDKACCPQYTTCAPGYNASTSWVRCNIQQSSLQLLASSTTVLSGASTNSQPVSEVALPTNSTSHATTTTLQASSALTTTSISTSTSTSTSTSVLTPVPPTTTNSPQPITADELQSHKIGLNSAAIAGIAVGTSVLVLMLVGGWFWWKRRSSRVNVTAKSHVDLMHASQEPPAYNSACHGRSELHPKTPKQELAARWSRTRSPVEMPVERF